MLRPGIFRQQHRVGRTTSTVMLIDSTTTHQQEQQHHPQQQQNMEQEIDCKREDMRKFSQSTKSAFCVAIDAATPGDEKQEDVHQAVESGVQYIANNSAMKRLSHDLNELALRRFCPKADVRIHLKAGADGMTTILLYLIPRAGWYEGSIIGFRICPTRDYPFEVPVVRCITPILHPQIMWPQGEVCIAALKKEWKPTMTINMILLALQLLLIEPQINTSLPLPTICHVVHLSSDTPPVQWQAAVQQTLDGGLYGGIQWPRNRPDVHHNLTRTMRPSVSQHAGYKRSADGRDVSRPCDDMKDEERPTKMTLAPHAFASRQIVQIDEMDDNNTFDFSQRQTKRSVSVSSSMQHHSGHKRRFMHFDGVVDNSSGDTDAMMYDEKQQDQTFTTKTTTAAAASATTTDLVDAQQQMHTFRPRKRIHLPDHQQEVVYVQQTQLVSAH